jgi:hypothetical protein
MDNKPINLNFTESSFSSRRTSNTIPRGGVSASNYKPNIKKSLLASMDTEVSV